MKKPAKLFIGKTIEKPGSDTPSLWQLSENKIAVTFVFCWGAAIFVAVADYSIFFFLVHFWNCSHFTVRYD